MSSQPVWIVFEYESFEGDRIVDVFATEDRAERYIAAKEHKEPGAKYRYRVKKWKVRG